MPDDLADFMAAHPPHPGMSAPHMIDVWEGLASLSELEAIATEKHEVERRDLLTMATSFRRQVAAAVRWVQRHHGPEVADAFTVYLSNASSKPGEAPRY